MIWQELLSSDPQVCGGEACASGTRVPAPMILDSLAEGASKEEVLASYPSLRLEYIQAVQADSNNFINRCKVSAVIRR